MEPLKTALGTVAGLCLGCLAQGATLSGDSNRPEMSTFIPGEEVLLTFQADGVDPKDKALKLRLDIADEQGTPIDSRELAVSPDDAGKWTANVKAPASKYGFYRVNTKLSDGTALASVGSRPAGFISYCVVPDPATRQLYPDTQTFFGMQGGFNEKVNILPYMGIRWVLGGLRWDQMDKGMSIPLWDWPKYATKPWLVYTLPSAVCLAPKWAESNVKGVIKPDAEAAFAEFSGKAAKAYAERFPNRQQRLYEVTYEVGQWTFEGKPEQLVRTCELAYAPIHDNDPKAIVCGLTFGGLSSMSAWEESFFKAGIARYLDAYSTHAYRNSLNDGELVDTIQTLRGKLLQYFGKEVPCYATEFGFITHEKTENELKQALTNISANLIYLGENWRVGMSFYIADYAGEPGFGYFYNLHPKRIFGTDKTAPKPVVPAYAAMTWLLEGHKSIERIEWLGEGTLGYAYEAYDNPDDIVLAVWDYSGKGQNVELATGSPSVTVYDWMGNAKDVKTVNGALTLQLKEEPTYIKGVSKKLWGSGAAKPLTLADARLQSYPNTKIMVKGTAKAPNGTVAVKVRSKGATVAAGTTKLSGSASAQDFAVELQLPASAAAGRHPVEAVLTDADGKSVCAKGLTLIVREPVSLGSLSPLFDASGKPCGACVTLTEERDASTEGTLASRLDGVPESAMDAKFSLAPGERKTLELRNDALEVDQTTPYAALLSLTLADGHTMKNTAGVNFTAATKYNPENWQALPALEVKGKAHVVRSPEHYSGDKDQAAKLRFAWDAKALRLHAEVLDDIFMQPCEGFWTWRGDSIQLDLDLDADKQLGDTGNTLADNSSRRHTQLDFALTKNGPETYRTTSFDPGKLPVGLVKGEEVELSVKQDGAKTIYDIALPWASLGAKDAPQAGSAIGFAIEFNDRDADEKTQGDVSALGLFELHNPKKFGKLTLLP